MHRPLSRPGRGAVARASAAIALAGALGGALAGALAPAGALPARAGPATPTASTDTGLTYNLAYAPRWAIPDAALLGPEDLGGATPTPFDDDGYWSALLPPRSKPRSLRPQ